MKNFSCFDIIGPVMVGPSSSHTAGAARLGKIAAVIAGEDNIKKVTMYLHGSFGKTYKGHGTDKALIAGILGMNPWDERLKDSIAIAKDKNLEYEIYERDLGDVHPNTVKFIIETKDNKTVKVMGSSIGGGNIKINEINGQPVELTGEYPTLIIKHKDIPGMISKVSTIIYEAGINIAFLKVYRSEKGSMATMIFETDNRITENIVARINELASVENIKYINPISEGE